MRVLYHQTVFTRRKSLINGLLANFQCHLPKEMGYYIFEQQRALEQAVWGNITNNDRDRGVC